ncbi:MAG: hypothetical protein ABL888_21840 [Pirellulaceae bacterium]
MNPMRKWLLILLGVVVGGYFVNMLVESYYLKPIAEQQQLAKNLEKKIREGNRQLQKLSNRLPARDDLELRSLPANAEMASSVYQAWLLNVVTRLGLGNPTVDSTSPTDEGAYRRLRFNIRGKANLRQFTKLLYEFFQAGHLHKITQISLTPTGGSDKLDLVIAIEALALLRSKNENQLTALQSDRLAFPSPEDYFVIARRNLFGEGAVSPLLRGTRLTAITSDRFGRSEVWLYVEPEKETHILRLGDSIELDSVVIRLKEIASDNAVLDVDGTLGRLDLGKTLMEIQPLGNPANEPEQVTGL